MGSVHATSHGMQNIAATVWFRKVTTDRLCFLLGQGIFTYRWTSVLGARGSAIGPPRNLK